MGTYTRFSFKASLRRDTPDEVIELLKNVICDITFADPIIDRKIFVGPGEIVTAKGKVKHPFFTCERWYMLLLSVNWDDAMSGGNFFLNGDTWILHLETEFKNQDDEINQFIDWITPYIHEGRKARKYLGWSKHENRDQEHYWKQKEAIK